MMRTALLLSSLFVAACTVGDIPRTGGADDTPGIDAGTTPTTDAGPVASLCVNRITPADPAHLHAGNVTHAGEGCMQAGAGCHANGGAGGQFQFGGTVYKPGAAKIASAGATVRVKSAGGTVLDMITDDAGNFHIASGSLPMPFPAMVTATACPTITPMAGALVQGGGNCTSAACHGGTTAVITLADQ
jgi:hypothetical protein